MNHNPPFLALVTLVFINTVFGSPNLYADSPLLSSPGDDNPREEQQNGDALPIESELPTISASQPESQPVDNHPEPPSPPQEHYVNPDCCVTTPYGISLEGSESISDTDLNRVTIPTTSGQYPNILYLKKYQGRCNLPRTRYLTISKPSLDFSNKPSFDFSKIQIPPRSERYRLDLILSLHQWFNISPALTQNSELVFYFQTDQIPENISIGYYFNGQPRTFNDRSGIVLENTDRYLKKAVITPQGESSDGVEITIDIDELIDAVKGLKTTYPHRHRFFLLLPPESEFATHLKPELSGWRLRANTNTQTGEPPSLSQTASTQAIENQVDTSHQRSLYLPLENNDTGMLIKDAGNHVDGWIVLGIPPIKNPLPRSLWLGSHTPPAAIQQAESFYKKLKRNIATGQPHKALLENIFKDTPPSETVEDPTLFDIYFSHSINPQVTNELNELLSRYQFERLPARADGYCSYHTLAQFLADHGVTHLNINFNPLIEHINQHPNPSASLQLRLNEIKELNGTKQPVSPQYLFYAYHNYSVSELSRLSGESNNRDRAIINTLGNIIQRFDIATPDQDEGAWGADDVIQHIALPLLQQWTNENTDILIITAQDTEQNQQGSQLRGRLFTTSEAGNVVNHLDTNNIHDQMSGASPSTLILYHSGQHFERLRREADPQPVQATLSQDSQQVSLPSPQSSSHNDQEKPDLIVETPAEENERHISALHSNIIEVAEQQAKDQRRQQQQEASNKQLAEIRKRHQASYEKSSSLQKARRSENDNNAGAHSTHLSTSEHLSTAEDVKIRIGYLEYPLTGLSQIPDDLQQTLRNNPPGNNPPISWYITRENQNSAGLVIHLLNGRLFVDPPRTGHSLNPSLNQPAGGPHWQKELRETASRRQRAANNTSLRATPDEVEGTLSIGQHQYPITFRGGTFQELSSTDVPHDHGKWREIEQFHQELTEVLDEFREDLPPPLDSGYGYKTGYKTEHQPHSAPADQPFQKNEGLNRYLAPLNQTTPLAESKKETEKAQQMGDEFYTSLLCDSEEEDSSLNDEESESECHQEEEKNCDCNPESSI